ncbi:DUF6875 domain-containing protein [Melissospora conviva]|uniref:DUF6875 domain-containing protein n=1 Tax=Melissospora conviva TaxID=3388432 RepID=UPI003B79A7C8
MLTHARHPEHVLVEQRDLLTADVPAPVADVAAQLRAVLEWAREYLCGPHPELGRKGPVCPFAQGSLERGTFFLAVHRGEAPTPETLAETLLIYRDWFRELPPVTGPAAQFKTVLLTFPDLAPQWAQAVVDETQARLKPRYVAEGLMIGEFHAGPPDKGGLWNPDFRPLRSPVPLLAIRHMVATDLPFLTDDAAALRSYLQRFGTGTPAVLRQRAAAAAHRLGLTPEEIG